MTNLGNGTLGSAFFDFEEAFDCACWLATSEFDFL